MCFDDSLRFADLMVRKTSKSCYGNLRREPEFCLTVWMRNMHVDSGLLPRKEEKPELTVADDRGCHGLNVADDSASASSRMEGSAARGGA